MKNKFFDNTRAQGTIEYLLIIAVVVVISLVVVGLVVSQTDSASTVSSTVSSVASQSGIVGAGDVVVDVDGEGIIVLSNNSGENLSVTGLSFGGIDNNYSTSVVSGDKKSFSVLSVGDACSCVGYEGTKRPCEVIVKTVSQYGLEKNYSMNINIDCVSNASAVDVNKLIQPDSYEATNGIGEYCLSNYKCLSGFCDSYLNNVCTDGSVDSNCADGTECAEPNVCTSHLCVDGDIGVSCSANSDCYSGYCGDDSYGCWDTCDARCSTGEIGSSCMNGTQCILGFCDTYGYYQCTDGSVGSYCGSGADCALGFCDTSWMYDEPKCTTGEIGSYCGGSSGCALGFCDTYNNYQCTDGGAGEYCGDNSGCASPYVCDTADTYTCVDGSLGVSCTSGLGCDSGFCYGSICTDGLIGTGCDSGNDCNSGFCNTDSNVCSTGVPGSGCDANADCDTYNCVSNVCSADLPAITSNLVAYWPFDETSGTTAIDYAGFDNNATLYNGVLVNQTGKLGKSYKFDGSNDYVLTNANLPLDNRSFSVSAWEIKSVSGVYSMLFGQGVGSPNHGLHIGFRSTNTFTYAFYANDVDTIDTYGVSTEFVHWVVTYNHGSTFKRIYRNGVEITNTSTTGQTPYLGTGKFEMGRAVGGSYFNGYIDEVAVWDRPLAPAEIVNLYNSGNGMSLIS